MKSYLYPLLFLFIFACKKEAAKTDYLGVVNITVTGNEEALSHFEKGLLLLHSFEYSDARESFIKAQDIDPDMAMAYWGEAMTYNHSLWSEQDYEDAVAVLQRLDSIDIDDISELEKGFIESCRLLYKAKTPKVERDKLYADYMKKLYKKYPDNHEVAAFYALSLLGSVPEGRDEIIYGQGAKIAQSILDKNPNHPGALHYLIHSYDDPGHAQLALTAANSYSKVAPDASHALHMPSHIYSALGMWDEVISSNIASYQASLNRMERKKLGNDDRGYHAFHWLEYGYLQKGNFDEAKKMVLDMQKYTNETPSIRARVHLIFLKGSYLVDTNDWDSDIADIPVDVSDLNIAVKSQYNFLEGMKAFKKGDKVLLDSIISNMQQDYDEQSLIVSLDGVKVCASVSRGDVTQTNIDESQIMQMQLKALRAWLENDEVAAEDWLKKSTALQDSMSFSYGPPFIQKPSHELYADWLVAYNRFDEAIEHYDLTLQRAKNRRLTLESKEKLLAENKV
ncbi:MAG: hypothetical protein P8X62_01190 [Flavobacteriaceae bacterium]